MIGASKSSGEETDGYSLRAGDSPPAKHPRSGRDSSFPHHSWLIKWIGHLTGPFFVVGPDQKAENSGTESEESNDEDRPRGVSEESPAEASRR